MAPDLTVLLSGFLVVAVILLVVGVRYHRDRLGKLEEDIRWAAEERRRLMQERAAIGPQWSPLLSGYPYDPRGFRFIGSPVEGVQFEADRIVFVSLGTASRAESERVRELVRQGRVEFVDAQAPAPVTPGPADASAAPP